MKILFVCTGNTCRSPMASLYFNKICVDHGRDDLISISAGICAQDGIPAAANALKVLDDIGCGQAERHRSTMITKESVHGSDLIIVMTEAHKMSLISLWPEIEEKVHLLFEFGDETGDVVDPFGADLSAYWNIFKAMKKALDDLFVEIEKKSE